MCETMLFKLCSGKKYLTVIVRAGNIPQTVLLHCRLGLAELDWLGDVEGRNSINFIADQILINMELNI